MLLYPIPDNLEDLFSRSREPENLFIPHCCFVLWFCFYCICMEDISWEEEERKQQENTTMGKGIGRREGDGEQLRYADSSSEYTRIPRQRSRALAKDYLLQRFSYVSFLSLDSLVTTDTCCIVHRWEDLWGGHNLCLLYARFDISLLWVFYFFSVFLRDLEGGELLQGMDRH
jgi:hypothetical protein